VSLAGRHFELGLPGAAPEVLAKRRYQLSWLISMAMIGELLLLSLLFSHWGDRLASLDWLIAQLDGATEALVERSRAVAATVIITIIMLLVVGYFSLYYLPWQRLERAIKRMQGVVVGKKPVWQSLRSTLASMITPALWICLVFAMPTGFLKDPTHFGLVLAAFVLTMQCLSPWLVQLGNPTKPLPADHPVTQMAMDLSRTARVRLGGVRIITPGEAKVANANGQRTVAPVAAYLCDRPHAGDLQHGGNPRHPGPRGRPSPPWASVVVLRLCPWRRPDHSQGSPTARLSGILPGLGVEPLDCHRPLLGADVQVFSRRFEREADRYAVKATGDVAMFQQALEKLAEVNGSVKQYAKWDIFQTHPPVAERIKVLG